ncbi:MAG: hypothetical protein AB9842_06340 [Bacteroidales bacterium]
MRVIACISGRSSKGKDSLLSSLAILSSKAVIVDCSFEFNVMRKLVPDRSRRSRKLPFFRGFSFDEDRCSHCRQCLEICHQHALDYVDDRIKYYEYRCSHCGSCIRWCPLMVLNLEDQNDISLIVAETDVGPVVYTESLLEPSLMPDMIRYLRTQALEIVKARNFDTILINGSKGMNDVSYLALAGVDAVIIVVSPSIWAITDLEKDVHLSRLSGVEPLIVFNLLGLDPEFDVRIQSYCDSKNYIVAGKIPADPVFRKALLEGKTILEYDPVSQSSLAINMIWDNVNKHIQHFRS